MTGPGTKPKRETGSIDTLPSGARRVRVYTGIDPISGRRHYLMETVPPGPDADDTAESVRARLLQEVKERRTPRTNASVEYILRDFIASARVEETTRESYDGYARKHVYRFIGRHKASGVDGDLLDSLYEELERCRDHCDGKPHIQHRTAVAHKCDRRCAPHECNPLSAWTVRKIHFMISGAYKRAIRKKWLSFNPATEAEPPSAPPPNPQPPSRDEAALIINEAWREPDFGTLVWCTITTGSRRGELCALRWRDFDAERRRLRIGRAIAHGNKGVWEKDTKTHQVRHIILDEETVGILLEHRARCERNARTFGVELSADAFIFATSPDGLVGRKPRSFTQKYALLVKKLGIKTTLHKLRHYSATELIVAGIDIRTVAGRLGHSGGGTTTLKIYAAWKEEADQRASEVLMGGMPARRPDLPSTQDRPKVAPTSPYELIAAKERQRIIVEDVPDGAPAPTVTELAARHGVSVGTAHRALGLLKEWGLVARTSRGVRPVIIRVDSDDDRVGLFEDEELATVTVLPVAHRESNVDRTPESLTGSGTRALQLEISRNGVSTGRLVTNADPMDFDELRRLLMEFLRRKGHDESLVGEFEMDVRVLGSDEVLMTFVA